MVIYIDVLLVENFVVNLFLLISTMKLLRCKYKRTIYIAAMIGSLYTLVVFTQIKFMTSFTFKLLVCVLMIYITIKVKKIVSLIKAIITFFLISFTLCGFCFTLVVFQNNYIVGERFVIDNSSIKYVLIGIMALYIVVVRIADYIKDRALIKNLIYDIEIHHKYEKLCVKGFLDTGNELREPVSNLPCILIEGVYFDELQMDENEAFYVGYKTIGEEGQLKGFRCQDIRIRNVNEDWKTIDAIVCRCKNKLSKENEYNALLSRGII